MMRVSFYALYDFKEDYCRHSISAMYTFNGVDSFLDVLNHKRFNSCKRSWKAWYHMDVDEGDRVYLSKALMNMK